MSNAKHPKMIETPPFCISCAHFIGLDSPESKSPSGESAPRCRLFPVLDIVMGERFYIACQAVRGDDAPCSTAGKLFKPLDDLDKPKNVSVEPDATGLN